MKSIFLSSILCMFSVGLFAQASGSGEYFSVCVAVAKNTLAGTGTVDAQNNPEKGADFVLSGVVYPADFFESFCPGDENCGIFQDGMPSHPAFAVGRWDMNAFTIRSVSEALDKGGTPTYSTQIFTFRNDFAPCPGCTIVTEGKDLFGDTENVTFKRAISGGTTDEFRLMRGEVEQVALKQPNNINQTGGYNLKVTFYFEKD